MSTADKARGIESAIAMSHWRARLRTCSTSSCRWSAAAAGRRRPAGVTPARGSCRAGRPAASDRPRVDPQAPVFSLGRYAGARRRRSSRSRSTAAPTSSRRWRRALAAGVHRLLAWGIVETPADDRARADAAFGGAPARRRPGHPAWHDRGGRPPGDPRRSGAADEGAGPRLGGPVAQPTASATSRAGSCCVERLGRGHRSAARRRHRHHRGDGPRVGARAAGRRRSGDRGAGGRQRLTR